MSDRRAPVSEPVPSAGRAHERVLLVGATGVLGAPALRALVAAGHDVVGTSRRADRLGAVERAGGRGLVLDVFDAGAIEAALDAARPTAVVFLATDLAGLDYGANARLREVGAPALVTAARDAGVPRLVFESVSWAPGDAPVAALERAVAGHPGGVVLRFGLLYGPRTWYAADGAFTAQAAGGTVEAIAPVTNWLHVDDAVEATVEALDWPAGAYDVVDDEPAALEDWAAVLAARAGFDGGRVVTSVRGEARVTDASAARALGWRPRHPSWRDGLGLG